MREFYFFLSSKYLFLYKGASFRGLGKKKLTITPNVYASKKNICYFVLKKSQSMVAFKNTNNIASIFVYCRV